MPSVFSRRAILRFPARTALGRKGFPAGTRGSWESAGFRYLLEAQVRRSSHCDAALRLGARSSYFLTACVFKS